MYSTAYFTVRESWRDWQIEARLLIEQARLTRAARALEVGCGSGGLLRLLHERGVRAVGTDTSETALNLAYLREDLPSHLCVIRVGDDPALPFCDGTFHAVISQHVIEHMPDADAALREWKRVLHAPESGEEKLGGRIALATPNMFYPDPAHFADEAHAHIFDPHELRQAVQRAGFVVEFCGTIFPFLSHARLFRALGVVGYRIFQRVPYFAWRGRTIVLSARKV